MQTIKDIMDQYGQKTTPNKQMSKKTIFLARKEIRSYVERNGLQSLVVGISGGLDSSAIAALCQQEFTGVPLIGISIPMSSSTAHKEQAQWVGDNYCDAFQEFKGWDEEWQESGEGGACGATTNMLSEVLATVKQTDVIAKEAGFNPATFPDKVLDGNIKARMRMITLYDMARKCNGMVLSTDNLSEFQMGFWTICGDVGDYGPIQNIGKGFELPAIARELGVREDIVAQAPSDGLMVTEADTDEAQLGANYQEVDTIMGIYLGTMDESDETKAWFKSKLFGMIKSDAVGAEKVANVISRYEAMAYKRNGTTNLTRTQLGFSND